MVCSLFTRARDLRGVPSPVPLFASPDMIILKADDMVSVASRAILGLKYGFRIRLEGREKSLISPACIPSLAPDFFLLTALRKEL
jgi:hypothetical protein